MHIEKVVEGWNLGCMLGAYGVCYTDLMYRCCMEESGRTEYIEEYINYN